MSNITRGKVGGTENTHLVLSGLGGEHSEEHVAVAIALLLVGREYLAEARGRWLTTDKQKVSVSYVSRQCMRGGGR